ncbi:GNAT family N-acetyltransferase [Kribbella sp. CA-245084]|uniref:GNAT family N-acetyltransferase n=1 Tax=Kribbella sp. CA-245084 TaxID=3239940 RepID=UPI003D8E3B68
MDISAVDGSDELARVTEKLIEQLPAWFGIPEANAEYVNAARELPGLLARTDGEPAGVLLYRQHFPQAAEIHLMAVAPNWHRQGIGAALVRRLVSDLHGGGCQLLQVKTLGPSRPNAGYGATRAFYRAMGFLPLEELMDLWDDNPCLLMVMPLRPSGLRKDVVGG